MTKNCLEEHRFQISSHYHVPRGSRWGGAFGLKRGVSSSNPWNPAIVTVLLFLIQKRLGSVSPSSLSPVTYYVTYLSLPVSPILSHQAVVHRPRDCYHGDHTPIMFPFTLHAHPPHHFIGNLSSLLSQKVRPPIAV